MKEATQMTVVNGIQNNETKQQIRDIINEQIMSFAKQTKSNINSISLPSSLWMFEKDLIQNCKKNKIPLIMAGVENGMGKDGKKVYKAFERNAPKNDLPLNNKLFLFKNDFDYVLNEIGPKCNPNDSISNVIWADYCGNPAKAIHKGDGQYRYVYPHINTFRDIVKKAKKPMLYFMTFSCNGRIKSGADDMMKTMSPTAKTMYSAIKYKISQTLCINGLSHKVTPILSIYYHGSGKSFMLTIGYAINFKPKFSIVKENWVKNMKTEKADCIDIKKEAMKILCDKGWDNAKIAHALNTQTTKVSAVISWHLHRDSWKAMKKIA